MFHILTLQSTNCIYTLTIQQLLQKTTLNTPKERNISQFISHNIKFIMNNGEKQL